MISHDTHPVEVVDARTCRKVDNEAGRLLMLAFVLCQTGELYQLLRRPASEVKIL